MADTIKLSFAKKQTCGDLTDLLHSPKAIDSKRFGALVNLEKAVFSAEETEQSLFSTEVQHVGAAQSDGLVTEPYNNFYHGQKCGDLRSISVDAESGSKASEMVWISEESEGELLPSVDLKRSENSESVDLNDQLKSISYNDQKFEKTSEITKIDAGTDTNFLSTPVKLYNHFAFAPSSGTSTLEPANMANTKLSAEVDSETVASQIQLSQNENFSGEGVVPLWYSIRKNAGEMGDTLGDASEEITSGKFHGSKTESGLRFSHAEDKNKQMPNFPVAGSSKSVKSVQIKSSLQEVPEPILLMTSETTLPIVSLGESIQIYDAFRSVAPPAIGNSTPVVEQKTFISNGNLSLSMQADNMNEIVDSIDNRNLYSSDNTSDKIVESVVIKNDLTNNRVTGIDHLPKIEPHEDEISQSSRVNESIFRSISESVVGAGLASETNTNSKFFDGSQNKLQAISRDTSGWDNSQSGDSLQIFAKQSDDDFVFLRLTTSKPHVVDYMVRHREILEISLEKSGIGEFDISFGEGGNGRSQRSDSELTGVGLSFPCEDEVELGHIGHQVSSDGVDILV